MILTKLSFWTLQFTQLFAVRFMRFLRDHRDSRLFPDLCDLFYSCFYAHEVLFRKLQFTRLFAVILMRCAWKFHQFQFKCVYSSYCFYADLTIYEFRNTKRRITVTTIVEGLTKKVLRQWKGLQKSCRNMSKPQKDDDLRDWMEGSVRSTFQKVQIIH